MVKRAKKNSAGKKSKNHRDAGNVTKNNGSIGGFDARLWLLCGLLLLAVGIIFGQTLGYDFADFDDNELVINHPRMRGGITVDSILWGLRDGPFHEWYPLATWSHMLDCQLYGLRPGGHHLSSVLLRAAASITLLVALVRMTGDLWPRAVSQRV